MTCANIFLKKIIETCIFQKNVVLLYPNCGLVEVDENIHHIYFSLLRAALWGQSMKWPTEHTDNLLRINAQQGTGAMVFPNVLTQEDIPAAAKMQMKGICLSTMQQQVRLRYTLSAAWRALTQAGITPVLMKGAGLAALYPDPQMRAWGDIDLFVGKAQYHPACAVMRDTFPNALKFDEELDHYKHYNLIADGISIEVHRITIGLHHPLDALRYERMEAYGVANAREIEIDECPVRIFEATFNVLFVMLHAWEHAMTKGANIRQICDLTLLLHHDAAEIDRLRLKRWLSRLHLTDVWKLYMWIAVDCLGLPQEEAPLYEPDRQTRAERFVTDMMNGALKPLTNHQSPIKNRFVRKWYTMQERLQNARRVGQYSPAYGQHLQIETLLHGALRLFAKDRHWE